MTGGSEQQRLGLGTGASAAATDGGTAGPSLSTDGETRVLPATTCGARLMPRPQWGTATTPIAAQA